MAAAATAAAAAEATKAAAASAPVAVFVFASAVAAAVFATSSASETLQLGQKFSRMTSSHSTAHMQKGQMLHWILETTGGKDC